MDRAGGDGRDGSVPWAAVFDPAANVRAFTAIQHEGFRAASELVDRFIRIASAGISPSESAPQGRPSEDQRAAVFGAMDMEPLIRSWWSMMGQFVGVPGAGGASVGGAATDHDATFDLAEVVAAGQLRLDVVAGGEARAEIWLVNQGRDDRGDVRLRCSDLLSDRGATLGSSSVTVEPTMVPMPGRSSRGVDVTVSAGADATPGVYRGTAMAEGYPDLWLPVAVTVRPPTP